MGSVAKSKNAPDRLSNEMRRHLRGIRWKRSRLATVANWSTEKPLVHRSASKQCELEVEHADARLESSYGLPQCISGLSRIGIRAMPRKTPIVTTYLTGSLGRGRAGAEC